ALVAPKAGISNETFLLDVTGPKGLERLVVRVEPTDFLVFPAYDLTRQARVMQCLGGSGIPVPHVRWIEQDPRHLGSAFYVMDRIEGEVPSEVPPYHTFGWCLDATAERRTRIWWNGIDTLAAVHAVDWHARGLGFLGAPGDGTEALDRQLGWWVFMDWATSEGYGFPRLEGFPGADETLRRYAAIAGVPVEHPLYQEMFAGFRFGIIMARIALRLKEIGAPTPTEHFETDNV